MKKQAVRILFYMVILLANNIFAQVSAGLPEIYITTSPTGAKVFIDGLDKGRAPVTITLPDNRRHILDIKMKGYENIRQTIENISGRKSLDFVLKKITGLAIIKTVPPGVNVKIDNIDRGTTPLLITDLPLGTYNVHLSAPGFLERNMELVLSDRIPVELKTALTPDTAMITVKSEPAGAEVTINGAVKGTTPCDIPRVPQGMYELSVKLNGYAEYHQKLRLRAGKSENIDVNLDPLPAVLRITTTPAADVYLNGRFKGVAPVRIKDLKPGEYTVRVQKKGYDTIEQTVNLNRGDDIVRNFNLIPNTGALEVTTEPSNVKIYVDDKWLGLTVANTNEADTVSDILTIPGISAGTHEIKFMAKGYFTKKITINIERDKTAIRHIKLKRRFIPDCEVRTKTDVYRGILVMVDPEGNIKMEVHPGVMRVIDAADVVSRKPLRMQDMMKELTKEKDADSSKKNESGE